MMGKFATLESPSMVDLPPARVIFARSSTMSNIQRSVKKSANANMPLLLKGESSTEKEILARFIQCHSPSGNRAFVRVGCAAISGTLLESELFGYGKGVSTGTDGTKPIRHWPIRGQVDESMGNLVRLGRVF